MMISEKIRTITISALETSRAIIKMIEDKSTDLAAILNTGPSEWQFDELGNVEITVSEESEGIE